MSEKLPTESVPCPSCGGMVRTAATTEESEWTICPHCKYEWACPPPRKPKATPRKPERRQVRLRRRFRFLLFTVGLILATTSVAICFEPARFAGGGINIDPRAWIVFVCAAACYSASRPWRWLGFSALLWAAARYGADNRFEWLAACVGTLCGLLLREPIEQSTLGEQSSAPEEVERQSPDPVVEWRRRRERRRMWRRRSLLFLSACVLVYVPCSLLGGYLVEKRKDELSRERREAAERAREREVNRLPGTPEHLIVLHRAPHDGFRTYADLVKELESSPLHNYRNESFRFVGKISGGGWRVDQFDSPYVEIKIRDRDAAGTHDTVYFRINAQRRPTPIERDLVIKLNDPDSGLVVIDGIFEDNITFSHCTMLWHGKGDDWDTALQEARKGLDLSKVNRKRTPGGD